jgi:hypothetical protein
MSLHGPDVQAAAPVALWTETVQRGPLARIVSILGVTCVAIAAAAKSTAMLGIGLVAGLVGVALALRRPRLRLRLLPSCLVVEHPPPGAEFPLATTSLSLDADSELLVLQHGSNTTTLPASDALIALIEFARAGLLVEAHARAHADARVFPTARTESGTYGSLLVTRERVAFVPHETAASLATALLSREPLRRFAADGLLGALRWLPAHVLEQRVAPLAGQHGLRFWRAAEVTWRGAVKRRSSRSAEPMDAEAGTVGAWRDAECIDVTLTYAEADALEWRVRLTS